MFNMLLGRNVNNCSIALHTCIILFTTEKDTKRRIV